MFPLLDPGSYGWNGTAMPWLVIAAVLYALAGVILQRQKGSQVGLLFCLMIALVAVWFTGFGAMLSSLDARVATIWARFALAAVCFLPPAIHDFTSTALRMHAGRHLVKAAWVVATVFSVITLLTRGIVSDVALHPWGYYPVAGTLVPLFLTLFVAALGVQLALGFAEYRRTADEARRRRIARLMLAFVVAYCAAIDFIPMFGVPMRPIGYVPVLAFILFAWKPIRKHRFHAITAARASREILETMADALFVIDADARIRVVNDAVRTLLGHREGDLLGRSIDTLEVTAQDRTISRTLRDLSRREPIREQERVLRHKSGDAIAVSVSISPVSDDDVQEGAVIIARDIRSRKRAEEELHAVLKRLEQSNRELEDFAYVASHDLQEPLRKIQAFGDLLKSRHGTSLPAQGIDYIDRMQSAARRMQVLINDLLSFSRVTTKAHPFAPVDLTAVAQEVMKDLEVRVGETGATITIAPLPVIEADHLQMRQILQNLVSNALKFHQPGVPPVIRIDGHVEGDERCVLEVSDNGIGFEEKYAGRIFTVFERLHSRSHYEGTGIGLAICRKIVERHGGSISAQSAPGEGSTFTAILPVRQTRPD